MGLLTALTFVAAVIGATFGLGKLFKSAPKRLLVLGMPQSGKTTLLKILRNEANSGEYVATNTTIMIEECKIKFKDSEYTLGKTMDIPGDYYQQLGALEKDVKEFFKEENGLILYIINCNDLNSEKLVDYSKDILTKAIRMDFEKAKVAIIYSHPDEAKLGENCLNKIHKELSDKLKEAEYEKTAEKFFNTKHYMINLVGKDAKDRLEQVFKDSK